MRTIASMNRFLSLSLRASMLVAALFVSPPPAPAQGHSVVGLPLHGENALEFLGRSDQDGPVVTHYGYLTQIFGLPDDLLFSDPATRTEATARFTFSATTTLTARHELGNIIVTTATGTLTLYLNETPDGDFDDPGSFASGRPIATFSARYHNVLNVQAPNEGIISAVADLVQQSAGSFTLDGRQHRLGRHGLRERIEVSGQGIRTQVDPLKAFFLLGARAIITDH